MGISMFQKKGNRISKKQAGDKRGTPEESLGSEVQEGMGGKGDETKKGRKRFIRGGKDRPRIELKDS